MLGAAGFLGSALTSALCDGGAMVEAFGRAPAEHQRLDRRARWTEAEVRDGSALRRALGDVDVVFHLLGPPAVDLSRGPLDAPSARVDEAATVLDACGAAGAGRIVFASSGGTVYGVAQTLPTPETAPARPISAYGASCLAIEELLEARRARGGPEYVVLRIANAYGAGQSPLRGRGVVASMLHHALTGRPIEIWGDGTTTRDFVHVDDVASALLHAARSGGDVRIMNVGSSHGRTLDQLVADIKEVLQMPGAPVVRVPPKTLDVPVSVLDTALIRRVTGWRPQVPWESGLAATARWLRATYAPG